MPCPSPACKNSSKLSGCPLPEDDPSPQVNRAEFLAGWIRLSLDSFKACYGIVIPSGEAKSWPELVLDPSGNVIAAACAEAAKKEFIDRLGLAIAKLEGEDGRAANEIVDMLTKVSGTGQMQAILEQGRGLSDSTVLLAAAAAADACAIVTIDEGQSRTPRGTAFLVRPDMVLTAAHVVLDCDETAGEKTWADRLLPGLSFSFKAHGNRSSADRVDVPPAVKNPLASSSKPYGTTDGVLSVDLAPPATPTLDYALIRLARRVEHIKPVTIEPPGSVKKEKLCWAFGFPGGNALKFDVNDVTDDKPGGDRWLHIANTYGGMSGGCCINHLGEFAGIHEGAIAQMVGGKSQQRNRGISIAAIRRAQCANGSDPMESRVVVPGLEFDDREMVSELCKAGKRLASPAFAGQWQQNTAAVFAGADPEQAGSLPGFHPWFPRRDFEDWIERKDTRERLCLVSGERGAGASFCKQILKARLDPSGIDYFELSPTKIVAFTPNEAVGAAAPSTPSANRTSAANFRYNDVEELIKQLRPKQGGWAGKRTVAIDFGPSDGSERLIGTKWQEFVVSLLAQDWVRLVLIGLTYDEQSALRDMVQGRQETKDLRAVVVDLRHVTRNEFEAYAGKLIDARSSRINGGELSQKIKAILPDATVPLAEMQTVILALGAITLESSL